MKVFLVYLLIDSHFTHGYNYGLGYIASLLKTKKHKVTYFSIRNHKDLAEFYSKIKSEDPGIIAFSSTSSQFYYLDEITKQIKINSNAFTVCGGAHVTLKPESINELDNLDAIVIGEGEYSMLELANALQNNQPFLNIKNFWFKKEGHIIKNSVRPLIEDLNTLPMPDKDLINYQDVIDKSNGINRFIFSRGCTFKCSYCSNLALSEVYPNKNKYFRQITPQRAIDEIKKDEERFNFSYIIFDDDTITLNKKWFFEFFNLYKKEFKYPFRCNLRVETVNEEIIKLLEESNASNIGIGLEHGNELFRKDELHRKMSNDQIKKVFKLCDKYNLTHNDFLMVGFPNENIGLYFDTVKLSREVSANGNASIFQPYPKTPLANLCDRNNWTSSTKKFQERKEAVIDFPNFSKEEIQLCADIFPLLNKNKFLPLINAKPYLYFLLIISILSKNITLTTRKIKSVQRKVWLVFCQFF